MKALQRLVRLSQRHNHVHEAYGSLHLRLCSAHVLILPTQCKQSYSSFSNNIVSNRSLLGAPLVVASKCHLHSKGPDEFDINDLFGECDPVVAEFENNRGNSGYDIDLQKTVYTDDDLISFEKNFRSACVDQSEKSEEEIQQFLSQNAITLSGIDVPKPVLSFSELIFPDHITRPLSQFSDPTPIQSAALPVALGGRDLVGIAQTGSGKTLSFLLPAIIHILDQSRSRRGDGPIALVLCPTRELAQQCHQVAKQFSNKTMNIACVFGGASKRYQAEKLHNGCELVIATPGRLLDFLQGRDVNLKRCTFLVLDEADRMLDMGFEPQIRKIVDQIRPDRQVTMWSATWPKSIEKLARDYLTSPEGPVNVKIGSAELIANERVAQKFEMIPAKGKQSRFIDLLEATVPPPTDRRSRGGQKILVFANQKRTCDYLSQAIRRCGYRADALHGDKTQQQRDRLLRDFRNGYCQVLVATDVASRGLDVDNIDYVFNYDFPIQLEDYIHRIGRTARGGKSGTSISMLTEENGAIVQDLIRSLEDAKQPVDPKLLKLRDWFVANKSRTKVAQKKPRYNNRSRGRYGDDYGGYQQRGYDEFDGGSRGGGYSSRNNRHNSNRDNSRGYNYGQYYDDDRW